jgi:hypothetical protein
VIIVTERTGRYGVDATARERDHDEASLYVGTSWADAIAVEFSAWLVVRAPLGRRRRSKQRCPNDKPSGTENPP